MGFLFGRMKQDENPSEVHAVVVEFRKKFMEEFGSTSCGAILKNFGEQENLIECKRMTGRAASLLVEIVIERKKPLESGRHVGQGECTAPIAEALSLRGRSGGKL